MSEREWKLVDAMALLGAGKMTMREAAAALGLSKRQARRVSQQQIGKLENPAANPSLATLKSIAKGTVLMPTMVRVAGQLA